MSTPPTIPTASAPAEKEASDRKAFLNALSYIFSSPTHDNVVSVDTTTPEATATVGGQSAQDEATATDPNEDLGAHLPSLIPMKVGAENL